MTAPNQVRRIIIDSLGKGEEAPTLPQDYDVFIEVRGEEVNISWGTPAEKYFEDDEVTEDTFEGEDEGETSSDEEQPSEFNLNDVPPQEDPDAVGSEEDRESE